MLAFSTSTLSVVVTLLQSMSTIASLQVTEYLGAGARQFGFMLRGLKSLEPALQELNIPLFLLKGHPAETIPKLVKDSKASLLVVDQSPVRVARQWREEVCRHSVQQLVTQVPSWLT